jgi:hypothetical protein
MRITWGFVGLAVIAMSAVAGVVRQSPAMRTDESRVATPAIASHEAARRFLDEVLVRHCLRNVFTRGIMMQRYRIGVACFAAMLFGTACGLAVLRAQQPPAAERANDLVVERLRPKWRVGDRWVIETQSLQLQRREEPAPGGARSAPLTWRFTVQAEEIVAKRPCFRVQAECQDANVQAPVTRLWVDRESYALKQVQTQLAVAGEIRTITESYEFPTGQPSPVLVAMMVVLPVDLPIFQQADTKGAKKFEFEAIAGPAGVKALDELSFAFEVEQKIDGAQPEQVKGLFHNEFAKSLTREPIANVQLKTGHRTVRQLWQANLPWPAFTDNGMTRSRLIKVDSVDNRP